MAWLDVRASKCLFSQMPADCEMDSLSYLYIVWKAKYSFLFLHFLSVLQGQVNPNLRVSGSGHCGDCILASEKTMEIVNCKTTFEGMFHFSYEVDYGGGGICDSTRSSIIACQEPGSPYVDNQVFYMNYGKCPAIGSSENKCRSSCVPFTTICSFYAHT